MPDSIADRKDYENPLFILRQLNDIDPFVELFFEHRYAGVVFVEPFLVLGDRFVLLVGVDDLGPDEDDDVRLVGKAVVLAEDGADDGEAAQAGDPGAEVGLTVVDHPAERDEVVVGDMDACFHVGMAGRMPVTELFEVVRVLAVDTRRCR